MTKHEFIKPIGNFIPFKVYYTLDNGLEISVIWENFHVTGFHVGCFFEAAIIHGGEIVSDETFRDLDFKQVADLKSLLESFSKETIDNMITQRTLWVTVFNFLYK